VVAGTFGQTNTGHVLASTLTRLATARVTICDLPTTSVGPHSVNGVEDGCLFMFKWARNAAARVTYLNKARPARQTDHYAER